VPRKKNNFSKIRNKKISLEDLPLKTIKVTIHALRWIFLLIFLFITIGLFVLIITGGESYVQMIFTWSITGFFTFFMGYFGWIFAQGILEMISGKQNKDEEHSMSYYFVRKKKKYKY
jgi:hypothetical protein